MSVAAAKSRLTNHLEGLRRSDLWLEGCSGVIVAVSGGPDSLALAFVAAEICVEKKLNIEAVVVDHGLRTESAGEASQVVETLKSRGIRSRCLRVMAPPPLSGKQAWARQQRMQLLCDYAQQTASAVLFAHHYNDQAETVAMRLARGSNVIGLSAIVAVRIYQGVLFARPFLGMCKFDLIAICDAYKAKYLTDPSNANQTFERTRLRHWLQQPDQWHLQQKLVQLAGLSARLSERLAHALDKWCAEHIVFTLRLRAQINFAAFSELNCAKQNFVLRHCLAVIGGQPYPVSDNSLGWLRVRLATGARSTAGNCLVQGNAKHITIMAEFGRQPEPELTVQAGRIYRFDKRWLIRTTKDGFIRRLGPEGWAKRNRLSGIQSISGWTARMGAMIPILHGLDGRRHCPHFIERQAVYSDVAFNPEHKDPAKTGALRVSILPVDGPCAVIKTDTYDR